jgi:aspartate/methionine/tyrosine aminotransferase
VSVRRLRDIPGFNIDRVAAAAGDDPEVLRIGLDPRDVSRRLLERKVAATPMAGWGGPIADRHVRFVFSNEPVARLAALGDRVRAALDAARPA